MTIRRLGILLLAALLAIAGSIWVSSQRQSDRSELAGKPVQAWLDNDHLHFARIGG